MVRGRVNSICRPRRDFLTLFREISRIVRQDSEKKEGILAEPIIVRKSGNAKSPWIYRDGNFAGNKAKRDRKKKSGVLVRRITGRKYNHFRLW